MLITDFCTSCMLCMYSPMRSCSCVLPSFVCLWACCNLFECGGAVMKRESCSKTLPEHLKRRIFRWIGSSKINRWLLLWKNKAHGSAAISWKVDPQEKPTPIFLLPMCAVFYSQPILTFSWLKFCAMLTAFLKNIFSWILGWKIMKFLI